MDYEVEGVRPRGRLNKIWTEVVGKKLPGLTTMQRKCYGSGISSPRSFWIKCY